jgi:hypothetical protein
MKKLTLGWEGCPDDAGRADDAADIGNGKPGHPFQECRMTNSE